MPRVLVIDDSEFVRNYVRDVLTDAGHEVLEAEDGNSGLNAYRTTNPDVILLDVLMPDIDGIEVLRTIRSEKDERPVLIMTGDDPGWARRTCEGYGATGFLSKALDADKLVETVEEVILDADT